MDTSEQIRSQIAEEEPEPALDTTPALAQKRRSQGRIIFDRFARNRIAVAGAVFLILAFLFCFLGPFVTGHNDPNTPGLAPTFANPSLQFPFGSDDVGRDTMARAIAGGQVSLLVGLTSMLISVVLGVAIGSVAGYYAVSLIICSCA